MKSIYLDTCVFIDFLAGRSSRKVEHCFTQSEEGKLKIMASPLLLQEIMTGLYREESLERDEIYALLIGHRGISWIAYDLEIADLGAKIRSTLPIKTPDAIHLATAIFGNCEAFVTEDRGLTKLQGRVPIRIETR